MAVHRARVARVAQPVHVEGLAARALDASDFTTEPAAIPVLVAYIDRPNANDVERVNAVEAIKKLLGPERAAATPTTTDGAAWREWLAGQTKP